MEPTRVEHLGVDEAFVRLWDHLVVDDELKPSDAIFCFGSRSPSVPAVAAELYRRGVAPLVLVTGGGQVEGRCEAMAYAEDLLGRGVPADAIVIEPRARHTRENVDLGLAALRSAGDVRRLVAVSWALGMRRALATFARYRPDLCVFASPARPDARLRWDATPDNIQDALGEWDRLERYAALGDIEPQPRPREVVEAAIVLRSHLTTDAGSARPRRKALHPRIERLEAPTAVLG